MHDFTDLPPNGGSGYDHAGKMRSTRKAQDAVGLKQINPTMMIKQKDWWRGQMDIATAAALESLIARDETAIEILADIRPKERPKLSKATLLIDRVPDELKGLASDHQQAVKAQLRAKEDGIEAKEAREYGYMLKCYAQEYIAYIRARGYNRLIGYYLKGGTRPRILDDV